MIDHYSILSKIEWQTALPNLKFCVHTLDMMNGNILTLHPQLISKGWNSSAEVRFSLQYAPNSRKKTNAVFLEVLLSNKTSLHLAYPPHSHLTSLPLLSQKYFMHLLFFIRKAKVTKESYFLCADKLDFLWFFCGVGRWPGHSSVLFTQNCCSLSGKVCIYEHRNEQVMEYLGLKGAMWGHQVKIPVQNKADFFVSSSLFALHPLRMKIIYSFPGLFFHVLNCESSL